ncbi:MAG: hypothetical protein AB2L07_12510 [Thermoanaerobaculaceae bacterium]
MAGPQYLQGLQAADPQANLLVIGDFNAFQFTDGWVDVMGIVTGSLDPAGAWVPGTDWVDPDLHNHTFDLPETERYSYIQTGNAQVLDHVLTSRALTPWVSEVQYGRANADAPYALADDGSTPAARRRPRPRGGVCRHRPPRRPRWPGCSRPRPRRSREER